MAYNVSDGYKSVIYSGDARHKLKLLFNGVELEDADVFCESLKVTSRIIPNGSTRFSLDNFIAKEAEIILHDIDTTIIQSPVNISIGTLVDGTYEYVPIGLFVVHDLPTTDKNKTTIKLRDYAVKFDFGYNAKPLIDENGGSVTKLQILQDICNKAGVETTVTDFLGSGDAVGIYDNSITARTYISYLAEQAGAIPTIDRSGKLIFVYLKDLETVEIPLEIVEKYEDGEKYEISRVVYEDAIRKFEAGEETKDTLFLNTANPYIEFQSQIESILELNKDIPINSFKTGKIIGNPAIDAYDIIKIVDDDKEFKTLATNDLTYNGVMINTFDTQIGKEAKKENVTLTPEATFKKWAKTEIDNVEAEVRINTGNIQTVKDEMGNMYTKGQVNELVANAETGVTNTFSEAGGNNVFRNTGLWFESNDTDNPYEFWLGNVKKGKNDNAVGYNSMLLQNGTLEQEQEVPNGDYSISFYYQKLNQLCNASVVINDVEYPLESMEVKQFYTGEKDNETGEYIVQPIVVSSNHINIKFKCDVNNGVEVYDLMCNKGSVKLAYSQNQNETTTDTVNISKGITITSSNDENVKFKADYDGIRTLNKNGDVKTRFTDKGMETDEAIIRYKEQTCGTLIQEVGEQTWFTRM